MNDAFYETLGGFYHKILVPDKILVSEKSRYQSIDIVELNKQKALLLDNFMHVWAEDEFIYHEMLAHFPLLYHPRPVRVLVLGAGDGFLLRELLKYKSIKEIVLVDVDKKVVDLCKKHFSEENCRSFDDPRVKVVISDVVKYADRNHDKFDVVILGIMAHEGTTGLYEPETLKKFLKFVKDDGIFATHGDDASPPNYVGIKLYARISKLFNHSRIGLAYVPSFESLWAFMVFSNNILVPQIMERVKTRFFEPERDYHLPPFLKEKYEYYSKYGFESLIETKLASKRIKLNQKLKDIIKKD